MSPVKAPAKLPELVRTAFNKARANGDLTYYATQVTLLHANSIPVSLGRLLLSSRPPPPSPFNSSNGRL